MKKDLQSYEKHNEGYENDTRYYTREAIIERTEKTDDFRRVGFELALALTKNLPDIHIDIGSGVGWLARKMSNHFKKSIGIELSHAAVVSARKLTEDLTNVSFMEADMIDGYKKLNVGSPVFFTTGAVFSHIENYYVAEFLKLINDAPNGSILFLSENYDKNIDWKMWHIRSKEWWRKHLPAWQLIFLDIENDGYSSGIYGIKSAEKNLLPTHERTGSWKAFWKIDKVKNIAGRVSKKIKRIIFS